MTRHASTITASEQGQGGPLTDKTDEMLSNNLKFVADILIQLGQRRKDIYTVEEVAVLARRSPYTVRSWIKDGLITATRVTGTGPRGRLHIARAGLSKITHAGLGEQIPAGAAD